MNNLKALSNLSIRAASPDDIDVLWDFLAIAAYEPSAEVARRVEVVAAHLAGWKRPGDFGVIAEYGGRPCGAAWARQYSPSEKPVFYGGPRTPEVSIGVLEEFRSVGIGGKLLKELQRTAAAFGLDGLCLNARDNNPAIKLYECEKPTTTAIWRRRCSMRLCGS